MFIITLPVLFTLLRVFFLSVLDEQPFFSLPFPSCCFALNIFYPQCLLTSNPALHCICLFSQIQSLRTEKLPVAFPLPPPSAAQLMLLLWPKVLSCCLLSSPLPACCLTHPLPNAAHWVSTSGSILTNAGGSSRRRIITSVTPAGRQARIFWMCIEVCCQHTKWLFPVSP